MTIHLKLQPYLYLLCACFFIRSSVSTPYGCVRLRIAVDCCGAAFLFAACCLLSAVCCLMSDAALPGAYLAAIDSR